jgi:hypothetical protein
MMKFEACYPIQAELYLKGRFETLQEVQPYQIKGKRDILGKEEVYNGMEGYTFLQSLIQNDHDIISLYEYTIHNNQLIERFRINDSGIFHVTSELTDVKKEKFLAFIFKLHGVLLYGEFDTGKVFCSRDEVCCEFAHRILPNHQPSFSATWIGDEPFINHFFMYKKEDSTQYPLDRSLALGGEPLGRETSKANFYLMKVIPRYNNEAYIQAHDDMETIQEFEAEMVRAIEDALSKSEDTSYRVYYSALQKGEQR